MWRAMSGCGALLLLLAVPGSPGPAEAGPNAAIPPAGTDARQDAEPSAVEQELASKYAPILYMQAQTEACEDGDPFVPAAVEVVLGQPEVALLRTAGELGAVTGPTAQDLFAKGEGYYLDFPGDPRSPGCAYEQSFRSFGGGQRAVTYAHIAGERGERGLAVQYWFFYYFNNWNNRHESDWEMIQLVFAEGTAEEALESEPELVVYSQHAGGERAKWSDSKVRKEDGRPVVYPSSGSHASYFSSATYLGKGESGAGFGCDDASGPYVRHDLEAIAVPTRVADPNSEFGWLSFQGRWGQELEGHNNGPTGPNTKESWRRPLSWAQRIDRDSNVTIPDQKGLGLSATDVFCGVVEGGSKLLFTAANHWVLSLTLLAATLGMVGYSSAAVVGDFRRNRADYRRHFVLQRRRSFGGILAAAARVYRAHWTTWVAIAAGLLPVALLLSLLARLVTDNPPVENILEVADEQALGVILALAYGVGSSLPFLLVATAGVIAGMRQVGDGEEPRFRAAWREVWAHRRPLLLARLKALGIILLLSVSVIGIPWAIKRTVDWYFIEQQIILEGKARRAAPRASTAEVRGHWWRTLGITAVLGFLGALAAPIFAALLILFTDIPLWLLNLTCSVAYLVLVPFVAIGLTFTHWDLQARMALPAGEESAAAPADPGVSPPAPAG
jgi:hypothetical protein